MSVASYKTYPPPEGFTASEIKRGVHWLYTDVQCPTCGKVQPVAATQYVGGPCVRCGELTALAAEGSTHADD